MPAKKTSISKKWRNAYILVIGVLFMLIVFFYFFTKQFA
jgi:hypothetical protein